MIRQTLLSALRTTLVTLLLTGVAYPLFSIVLCQTLLPGKAAGSLVQDEHGQVVGSALVGQRFVRPGYFQPRPSAAGDSGYDASASGGSNLGPTSRKLRERVQAELVRLRKENAAQPEPVPVELLTTSASGLDPHLSVQSALWQVARIAKARSLSVDRVRAVVLERMEGRDLGFLGEPRVNVLLLNLALDRRFGRPGAGG